MYSYIGTLRNPHNQISSPPETYQFPAHILNAQNTQVYTTNSQQSYPYSNDVFKFPHHQPSFESYQSIMNSDYPPVNSAVNLYPLPPLTTGGKSVMSSVPSQSTVGKSVVSTNTTASVSTNNQVSNQESKTELFIENPVLTYIRSQMFRLSQAEVISLTSANFGFDELKVAREALFRKSGTRTYKYVGPNDPATQVEKSNHCCAGIISKLQDLQKRVYL